MGRFNNPQEVEQFLMKNRDAIRDHRRRYIAAVLGNNMSAAKAVKNEFESRFNMPLTVTQDQFKQAQKLRDRSIVSRTLDTMDRTVRDQYREAVAQSLPGQLMDMEDENRPQERGDVYRFGYR
jgi:Mg-chelatase subunit ChlD